MDEENTDTLQPVSCINNNNIADKALDVILTRGKGRVQCAMHLRGVRQPARVLLCLPLSPQVDKPLKSVMRGQCDAKPAVGHHSTKIYAAL